MKEEQERVETRTQTSFPIFIEYSYDWQAVLDGLRENPEIKDGRDINWIKLGVRRTFPPSLPPSLPPSCFKYFLLLLPPLPPLLPTRQWSPLALRTCQRLSLCSPRPPSLPPSLPPSFPLGNGCRLL